MNNYKYVTINIDKLYPDPENFRFDPVNDFQEAIVTIVNQSPTKMYNLAKSILDNGMDPSTLPNIVPYEKDSDKYVVMEGNRRITVLKIIKDIFIIASTPHYEKFKKLIERYDTIKVPDEYFCTLYENKEDTYFWTYLRHAGQLDGEGLLTWDTLAIDRFKIATKQAQPNLSYYVINYLKSNTTYQIDTSRLSTTLNRILESSVGKSYYGIAITDQKLIFDNDVSETIEKIVLLISKIRDKVITSRNTNKVSEIKEWIDRLDLEYQSTHSKKENIISNDEFFTNEMPPTVPSVSKSEQQSFTNNEINPKSHQDNVQNKQTNQTSQIIAPNNIKPKRFLEDLAFAHLDCNKDSGIVNLCCELVKLSKSSSYNYVTYPIASAMLLRSLIEQAFKHFLTVNNQWNALIEKKTKDPSLGQILTYCRDHQKLLFPTSTILRLFNILFDKDSTVKDFLDLNIHHPNIVRITSIELNTFSNKGISCFINFLLQ